MSRGRRGDMAAMPSWGRPPSSRIASDGHRSTAPIPVVQPPLSATRSNVLNSYYHMKISSDYEDFMQATELVDDHHRECWITHCS